MALASRMCLFAMAVGVVVAGGCAGDRSAQSQSHQSVASSAQAAAGQPRSSLVASGPTASAVAHASSATLVVHGMGCPLCANNVDKQLLKLSGVEKVNVDLGSGKVKVVFAAGMARPGDDKLSKAVANSGYTLVRIQTP